jgi:hypothetical protein
MNNAETVYIIGESKTNKENAITSIYNSFYIAFEVDTQSDRILDASCSHTINLTEKFVKSVFMDKDINASEEIEQEVKRRYHGSSQKAIIVAYKDALKKYEEIKEKYY